MDTQTASPVLPHEIIGLLITHWLWKVTESRGPTIDLDGAKLLKQLINDVLSVINPPIEQWNKVADFVLNDRYNFDYDYDEILWSLSSRVSAEMCERIVGHFVAKGNVYHSILTASELHRNPTKEELSVMLEYHYKRALPNRRAWDDLTIAVQNFAPDLTFRIKEVAAEHLLPKKQVA